MKSPRAKPLVSPQGKPDTTSAAAPRKRAPRKAAAAAAEAAPRDAADTPAARLEETAARNTLAVNPLIGLNSKDFGEGAQAIVSTFITHPAQAAKHLGAYAKALGQVLRGKKDEQPTDAKDRRFADPAWQHSPIHRRLLQAHATTSTALNEYLESTTLKPRDHIQARK